MANKHYKAGMKEASKMYEEKFRKQGEAVERVAMDMKSGMSKISGVQDKVIDIVEEHEHQLWIHEKRELYGLESRTDIAKLDPLEKELIAGILFSVANENEEPNNSQKQYLSSVLAYIEIASPPTNMNISSVERIDSTAVQRAILQLIFEYQFLRRNNFDFLNDFDDVMNHFSINLKGIEEIKEYILKIYRMIGASGLSEKYGHLEEDELEKSATEDKVETREMDNTWLEISQQCADIVGTQDYIETDNYLVYFERGNRILGETSGLHKVNKMTGEDVLIKTMDVVDYQLFPKRIKADKDILFYHYEKLLCSMDLNTHQEKQLLNKNNIVHFQIQGDLICYETDENYKNRLYLYNMQTKETVEIKQYIPVRENTLVDLYVRSWLFQSDAIYFIPDSYELDGLTHHDSFLYKYQITDRKTIPFCDTGWGSRPEIVFHDNKILILFKGDFEHDVRMIDLDLSTETFECKDVLSHVKCLFHKGYLFFVERKDGFPVYKMDLDTMERVQLASDCGHTSYSKKTFFKPASTFYWPNSFHLVGNWLYFTKREKYNIFRVAIDKPMQMVELVKP